MVFEMSRTPPVSQNELECKLNRTRAADLILRTEAAASQVSAAETLSEHFRRVPKLGIADICNGWSKVRVIQNVEDLRSELQFQQLVQGELAMHGKIPLRGPKSPQCIA